MKRKLILVCLLFVTSMFFLFGCSLIFSDDADLLDLSVSDVSITPVFSPKVLNYTVSVAHNVSSVTINARKRIQNAKIVSGTGVHEINIGNNIIDVVVKTEYGFVTKTYTINVIRAVSDDADLLDLSVSDVSITPVFSAEVLNYTVSVANDVSSVTVNATKSNEKAKIVSGIGVHEINLGNNIIDVVVEAEDGIVTKTYTINVIRAAIVSFERIYSGDDPVFTFTSINLKSIDKIFIEFSSGSQSMTNMNFNRVKFKFLNELNEVVVDYMFAHPSFSTWRSIHFYKNKTVITLNSKLITFISDFPRYFDSLNKATTILSSDDDMISLYQKLVEGEDYNHVIYYKGISDVISKVEVSVINGDYTCRLNGFIIYFE